MQSLLILKPVHELSSTITMHDVLYIYLKKKKALLQCMIDEESMFMFVSLILPSEAVY